jgi:plastocyanin
VGEEIIWTNKDPYVHNIKAGSGEPFDSRTIYVGDQFHHTFPIAGTFEYSCSAHKQMTGKIIVVP